MGKIRLLTNENNSLVVWLQFPFSSVANYRILLSSSRMKFSLDLSFFEWSNSIVFILFANIWNLVSSAVIDTRHVFSIMEYRHKIRLKWQTGCSSSWFLASNRPVGGLYANWVACEVQPGVLPQDIIIVYTSRCWVVTFPRPPLGIA